MIALEITLNGMKLVTAGASNLDAITASIDALPEATGNLNVFGIVKADPGYTQRIATWKDSVRLVEGDEIVIRIRRTEKADPYESIDDPIERA